MSFCILTVTRTKAIRFAKWDQMDIANRVWTIPPAHMKSGKEYRVALSDASVQLVNDIVPTSEYVFAGWKAGKALSSGGMSSVLKRMSVSDATVHGFRSTFRDYIGEATELDPIVAEHCLAHKVGNATERAYARGDMLAKRFNMMNIWGNYVTSELTNASSSATRV